MSSTDTPDPCPAPATFDETLAELEALVERMEQGELSLEESLATFEQGIHLSRHAQRALTEAEQTVHRLLDESGATAPLDSDDDRP